jgi:leucine dehydrogenase
VGEALVNFWTREGAIVTIADINEEKLNEARTKYRAQIFRGNELYNADVDIYAPCAMGATLNTDTVHKIKAKVIAGGANNQLADENIHCAILQERGILYALDFLINAGGIINVCAEIAKYDTREIMRKTENIRNNTLEIFVFAIANKMKPHHAALTIAQKRINERKIENGSK